MLYCPCEEQKQQKHSTSILVHLKVNAHMQVLDQNCLQQTVEHVCFAHRSMIQMLAL